MVFIGMKLDEAVNTTKKGVSDTLSHDFDSD